MAQARSHTATTPANSTSYTIAVSAFSANSVINHASVEHAGAAGLGRLNFELNPSTNRLKVNISGGALVASTRFTVYWTDYNA